MTGVGSPWDNGTSAMIGGDARNRPARKCQLPASAGSAAREAEADGSRVVWRVQRESGGPAHVDCLLGAPAPFGARESTVSLCGPGWSAMAHSKLCFPGSSDSPASSLK
ncbi:hypothetical protein CR201_G0055772 [Pongo abelii]|uniref:Uncharacterized protein n=1 Tax=Pongo abelii TaxID=9601 RepID=A0A2J8QZC1_PONAB|nr:hypothetical protein CR201_G0055772 [Pongo abelii]